MTGDTVMVQLGDGITSPKVSILITDNGDGTFKFDVTQSGSVVGDLRGLFFDVAHDTELGAAGSQVAVSNVSATGTGVASLGTTVADGNDTVTKVGNSSNNMNGALSYDDVGAEAKGYDVGIEFGSEGIGKDDVRSVSFTFTPPADFTINDFVGMDFGVRMMSVGVEGGARDGSVKLTGSSFAPVPDANEDIDCVLENGQASGDVIKDTINGAGGVTVTQILTSFTLDGNTYHFDATHHSFDVPLTNTVGAHVVIDDHGNYTVYSGGDALGADEHIPFDLSYSIHQTYTDEFHHVVGQLDETSDLTFKICGENDQPVAVDDDAGCIVENGSANGNVIAGTFGDSGVGAVGGADSDIDRTDTVLKVTSVNFDGQDYALVNGSVTIDLNGNTAGGATLTMHDDGTWSFATNGMYDSLNTGQDVDLKFTYTLDDGHNLPNSTDTADLLICIQGQGSSGGQNPPPNNFPDNPAHGVSFVDFYFDKDGNLSTAEAVIRINTASAVGDDVDSWFQAAVTYLKSADLNANGTGNDLAAYSVLGGAVHYGNTNVSYYDLDGNNADSDTAPAPGLVGPENGSGPYGFGADSTFDTVPHAVVGTSNGTTFTVTDPWTGSF